MNTNPNHQNLKASGDLPVTLAGRVFCDADPLGAVPGGNTPTPADLQAFAQTGMPHEAAVETISRLIDLFPHLPQDCGLVGLAALADSEGREFGAVLLLPGPSASANMPLHMIPYAEIYQTFDNHPDAGHAIKYPLTPLVHAWRNRPVDVDPECRQRAIIPSRLAHATPAANRKATATPVGDGLLFTPAHYAKSRTSETGQLPLPLEGFGVDRPPPSPALPLSLYALGKVGDGHGHGAPMALRLFVESILTAPLGHRERGQPVAMTLTLNDLIDWLYPGKKPSPREYWRRLIDARRALNSDDALVPLINPATGIAQLRQVVTVTEFPADPDPAGDVRILVDLPKGHGNGPQIDRQALRRYGLVSAPAYRMMLGLAYQWHNPGVTVHPGREGLPWLQSDDPAAYPDMPPELLVRLAYPDIETPKRYHLQRARKALAALIEGGTAQEIGGKILPLRNPN